jgi:hypothetical protein
MTGIIYTWGRGLKPQPEFAAEMARRLRFDTAIDLTRPSSQLSDPPDLDAVGQLYAQARAGHRILLVCSHAEPRRCHRHAALALPIAQDAANYALARKQSKLALPVQPIDVKHVLGDILVDPLEYEAAVAAGRKPKGKKWR